MNEYVYVCMCVCIVLHIASCPYKPLNFVPFQYRDTWFVRAACNLYRVCVCVCVCVCVRVHVLGCACMLLLLHAYVNVVCC
jgi:hypothetical protein